MRAMKKPTTRRKGDLLGTIFEDKKLKRFVRVATVSGKTALIVSRRSTTGRFTETGETVAVSSLRAPRFRLWRNAPEK